MKRADSEHPVPTGADDKLYSVDLSEREMQCISNACSAFYRVMGERGVTISPEQTVALVSALQKMKQASVGGDGRTAIGLVDATGRSIL